MTTVALVLYAAGLATAFGGRTWVHRRRTGSSGFHGISGPPGSLRWWAGMLFVLAVVLAGAAPILVLTDVSALPEVPGAVAGTGLGLMLLGLAGVLGAQTAMGTSWRVGVSEAERTDLVTDWAFAVVRNPVFSAMVVAVAGLAAAVPTALSLTALGCLVAAVQLQVRVIEEPYLLRVHGADYGAYAARTGRFVPGVGHLRPAPRASAT